MSENAKSENAKADALWTAKVLTLFPAMFPGPLGHSLAGRGLEKGLWRLDCIDIRQHTPPHTPSPDKHRRIDDAPFGGGGGMVMRADVAMAALEAALDGLTEAEKAATPRLYFSPRGTPLTQARVRQLASSPEVVMLCGRYEGLDQRMIDHAQLIEVSMGDFVLSGGEVPALMLIDAVVRLLPGVMGNAEGHRHESFEDGLLEHPLYTQPREWRGLEVPPVLLSGDHAQIAAWRQAQAEAITQERRPDLWAEYLKAKSTPKKHPQKDPKRKVT